MATLLSHEAVLVEEPKVENELGVTLDTRRPRLPFLQAEWRTAWWRALGRGRRLTVATPGLGGAAPATLLGTFFVDGGMAFPAAVDGADRLDLLGNTGDADALASLLSRTRDATEEFVGIRLYHLPAESPTVAALPAAAKRAGLTLVLEEEYVLPAIDLRDDAWFDRITDRTSLRRHDRALSRLGRLELREMTSPAEARQHLPGLFEQHVRRRASLGDTSLFADERQRAFYGALVDEAWPSGWLHFAVLTLDERPIAYHFGTLLDGVFLWYKPTFDHALARYSPGEVLLRRLLLRARDAGATTFDFGLGDEPFKRRFATSYERVLTYGLYDPAVLERAVGS